MFCFNHLHRDHHLSRGLCPGEGRRHGGSIPEIELREGLSQRQMSSIPKSTFTCPVCNQPLCKLMAGAGRILLWCGNGPCTSYAANDGESGVTEQEAYDKIKAAVENQKMPARETDEDNQ